VVIAVPDAQPPYAYTVGLTQRGRAELVTRGFHPTIAAWLLGELAGREENLHTGQVLTLHHSRVRVEALSEQDTAALCKTANALYGNPSIQRAWDIVPTSE
jgi:hypothetical protein